MGKRQQFRQRGVQRTSKLRRKLALRGGVVGGDSNQNSTAWMEFLQLVQLLGVVDRGQTNVHRSRVSDERVGLARVGIDDAVGRDSNGQNGVDLTFRSTIEVTSGLGQKLDDLQVGVTLDGVEWLDLGQLLFPQLQRSGNFTEVTYKEGILVASLAGLMVNGDGTLHERFVDQRPSVGTTASGSMNNLNTIVLQFVLIQIMGFDKRQFILINSRGCHNLTEQFRTYFLRFHTGGLTVMEGTFLTRTQSLTLRRVKQIS